MPKDGDWVKDERSDGSTVEYEYHKPVIEDPQIKLIDAKSVAKDMVANSVLREQSTLIAEGLYFLLKKATDVKSKDWVKKYESLETQKTEKETAIDNATDEQSVIAERDK